MTSAPNAPTLVVAILVILMMSLYAHAKGDAMGAAMPRRFSLRAFRNRRLSEDLVELVGGHGKVRVTVAGDVADMESYPPVPAELRAAIRDESWLFPADLPIGELERRLEETLRKEFDLAESAVTIDDRGRASIAAAPPTSGVSKRVPAGHRAVSIETILPTGLARGDEVRVRHPEDAPIRGTVISARTGDPPAAARADGGDDPFVESTGSAHPLVATGGHGRLTIAVKREAAARLLAVDRAPVVVLSRGTRREFEVLSLLRQAGNGVRRFTIAPGSDLEGSTIAEAAVRDTYGVAIVAVRTGDAWSLAPRGSTRLDAADDLFVVGPRSALDRFEAVVG